MSVLFDLLFIYSSLPLTFPTFCALGLNVQSWMSFYFRRIVCKIVEIMLALDNSAAIFFVDIQYVNLKEITRYE